MKSFLYSNQFLQSESDWTDIKHCVLILVSDRQDAYKKSCVKYKHAN